MEQAVRAKLTSPDLVEKMRRNVRKQKFTEEHYINMWSTRVADSPESKATAPRVRGSGGLRERVQEVDLGSTRPRGDDEDARLRALLDQAVRAKSAALRASP